MKNGTKIEEELTFCFKIDMRNLTNFYLSTQSLKDLHFDGLLATKVYNNVRAKKYRGVIFHDTEK